MTSREKLSSDCAEPDSNIIKYVFKGYKLSEIARNIYSYIIKGLSHWNRWILSLVGISTDARKLASFDIPTRDNIHRYQCNNPIVSHYRSRWRCSLLDQLSFEPAHEIMVLFVLRKFILQTRMRRHPVGARCQIFGRTLRLLRYLMCANSQCSGETVWMRSLAWAFAVRLCDKHHNLMSWLNFNVLQKKPRFQFHEEK